MMDQKPLLVIVGETASGKSQLAIKIAQQLNGEIICADSTTVRKKLDIATAKPTIQERKSIRHHLLDIVEPLELFTAYDFKIRAESVINDIRNRKKMPILVGGSGLYIDSVIYDYSFSNHNDSQFNYLKQLPKESLIEIAKKSNLDLSQIDSNNPRRIINYIKNNGTKNTRQTLKDNTLIIGIKIDKDILKKRIAERVNLMFEIDIQSEIKKLKYDLGDNYKNLNIIGYKEWIDYNPRKDDIEVIRQKIIINTYRLAKKQRTWFFRNKDINWIDYNYNMNNVVDLITTRLINLDLSNL